jgi:uncharacterized protein DUF3179
MAGADLTPTLPEAAKPKGAPLLSKGLALGILALLLGYILVQVQSLWGEWRHLRRELDRARHSTVIGYVNINPNPSYAAIPPDWVHDEGDATLLWSGWKPDTGHGWFRVGRGEVEQQRLSRPIGRDVIQAIDWPLVEAPGGQRWERIPWDAQVAGVVLEGISTVYPLLLLRKVEIINDTVHERPLLVTYLPLGNRPLTLPELAMNVYDPVVAGERLTMGLTGYFHDQKPVLYDRRTESLWLEDEKALTAFAGRMKGTKIERIGKPDIATWSNWLSRYPQSRLIVGNDRSKGLPKQ